MSTVHRSPFTVHCLPFTLSTLLLLAGAARGTEYFVATNGLDSNSGADWTQPLRTIGAGVAIATNSGDIVTVSNGTYTITSQIVITNAITVRSFMDGLSGASNTIVQVNQAYGGRVFSNGNANAAIAGLTIRGGYGRSVVG